MREKLLFVAVRKGVESGGVLLEDTLVRGEGNLLDDVVDKDRVGGDVFFELGLGNDEGLAAVEEGHQVLVLSS